MPALHLTNSNKQNGFRPEISCSNGSLDETLIMKKKLLLTEQAKEPEVNNNERSCIREEGKEEQYGDLRSIGANGKFLTDEDQPSVFGDGCEIETSIGRSAKDQFADALLRLQSDLHNTTERLSELATKVDKINLSRGKAQQEAEARSSSRSSVFNRNNVTTLFYFSWPVVVFFAIRALEKRSVASK